MPVPSGITIGWPSTVGTIPTGFTRVSALDDKYARGASSYGGAGGGATHTHTTSAHTHTGAHTHTALVGAGGWTGALGDQTFTAGLYDSIDHYHNLALDSGGAATTGSATCTLGTGTQTLSRTTVIWISSNGTNDFPVGGVGFWHVSGTAPTNWAINDGTGTTPDLRNKFLIGATTGNGGGTANASATHTHSNTAHAASHTYTTSHSHGASANTTSPSLDNGNTGNDYPASGHSHTTSGTTGSVAAAGLDGTASLVSDAQTPDPAWYKLHHIKKTGSDATIPKDLIAIWNGTTSNIPVGWQYCDGGGTTPNLVSKMIKGANGDGERGTTGGSDTHTHTETHSHPITTHTHGIGSVAVASATSVLSSWQLITAAGSSYKTQTTAQTHSHSGFASGPSGGTSGSTATSLDAVSNNSLPPYIDVIYVIALAQSSGGLLLLGVG